MSIDLGFNVNDIKYYLLSNGGSVEYHELVKAFRHHLSNPLTQHEARIAFKDYVNRLATVSTQQNKKYLVLRPEFCQSLQQNVCPPQQPIPTLMPTPMPTVVPMAIPTPIQKPTVPAVPLQRIQSLNSVGLPKPVPREPPIGLPLPLSDTRRPFQPNNEMRPNPSMISMNQRPTQLNLIPSSIAQPLPSITPTRPMRQFSFSSYHNEEDSDVPPQPPPRRRSSAAGNKPKIELRLKPFGEDRTGEKFSDENQKESPSHQIEKLKEIHELSTKTPGRVKERAQKIDKMASLSDLKLPMPSNVTTPTGRPKSRTGTVREADDNDSGSVQTLDPLRRKWINSAASCDYNSLVLCLKEEPKLSSYKDFTNGFTALHWAAKAGKPEIIKLIAGTYGVNPNMKSHGGYTPLHLAAIQQHHNIIELLTNTYQADPNIRDHSGKRPAQYLKPKPDRNSQNHSNGYISSQPHNNNGPVPTIHKSIAARIAATESSSTSFIRIGSLKAASKVKKITGIGPKSWGSVENVESIPENGISKKSKKNKKNEKNSKRHPTPERPRDSDSDSAYGFQ